MADPAVLETAKAMEKSLEEASVALAPLLERPLAEWIEDCANEPVLKAKLQTMVSYVVHDLSWVFLKLSGVDTSKHPVMAELNRVREYFGKIAAVERSLDPSSSAATAPQAAESSKSRQRIDRDAASRFINAAVSQGNKDKPLEAIKAAKEREGHHLRFEEDAAKLLESSEAESSSGSSDDDDEEVARSLSQSKGKGKQTAAAAAAASDKPAKASNKAERPKMDPFAGYSFLEGEDAASKPMSKKAKKRAAAAAVAAPEEADGVPAKKKTKKSKKAKARQEQG